MVSYSPTNAAEAAILGVVYLDESAKSIDDVLRLWDESRAWEKLWEYGALVRGAEFRYSTRTQVRRYLQNLATGGVLTVEGQRGTFLVRPLPNTRVEVKGLPRVAAPAADEQAPKGDEPALEQMRSYLQSALQGVLDGARSLRPDLAPLLERYTVRVDLDRK